MHVPIEAFFSGPLLRIPGKSHGHRTEEKEAGMFLHDKERGNKYPIFEDENGTHIMSPNDVCMIDELEDLMDAGIDSFKIDGVLKSPEYLTEVTRMYREAIDLCFESRETYEEKKRAG